MSCEATEIRPFTGTDAMSSTGTRRDVVEVTVLWMNTVQSVVEKRLDEKGGIEFVIGEDPTCDFVVSTADLGGCDRFVLAAAADGVLRAATLPGMRTMVFRPDGGAARASLDDSLSFYAAPDDVVEIGVGPVVFRIRMSARLDKVTAPLSIDKRTGAFLGLSAFLHAAVLFTLYLVPPDGGMFNMDNFDTGSRMMKIMLTAPEAKLLEEKKPEEVRTADQSGGKAHEGPVGQMGDRHAAKTNNRSAVKGPPDTLRPRMQREVLKEMANTAGILGILSAAKMPVSPFGSDSPVGFDPENALGALVGDEIGPNFGLDGLGPKGTGRAGGGDGRDTIGVGRLGTIAWSKSHGNCTGAACPTWSGGSGAMKGRRGGGPRARSGTVAVHGSLSKETIRRIVRRHLNEVRFCYEQGLRKRPDLSGQVAIKFIISPSGSVQTAAVSNTTLGDGAVELCISKVVQRMSFPMPDNSGIVVVTYPLSLTSADS